MLFGRICCRTLKSLSVVDDGIKIGGEEKADMVSSDSSFEGDIDENLEVKRTAS